MGLPEVFSLETLENESNTRKLQRKFNILDLYIIQHFEICIVKFV